MSDELRNEEWQVGECLTVGVTRRLEIPGSHEKTESPRHLPSYSREFIKVMDKHGRHVAWVDVTDLGLVKAKAVAAAIADLPALFELAAEVEADNRRAEKGEKF
jgi:hypothetical protein